MRVNVYGEELTLETQLVKKSVTDEKFGDRTFYGLRMFLASPEALHSHPVDDDRSAVTIWIPWTKKHGHDFEDVEKILNSLLSLVHQARHDSLGHYSEPIPYEGEPAVPHGINH